MILLIDSVSGIMEGQLHLIIVGARFKHKKELKVACQNLATHKNFEYMVVKSDKSRMRIKCLGEGCSWSLYTAKIVDEEENPFFRINTMNSQHSCFGVLHLGHRQAHPEH